MAQNKSGINMKGIIIIAIILVAVIAGVAYYMTRSNNSRLSGKYTNDATDEYLEFSGNKIKYYGSGTLYGQGTYELTEDGKTLNVLLANEDDADNPYESTGTVSTDKNTVTLWEITFVKK